ncbi:TPA: hypothetical protein I7187_13550 [Vibrio vulnificus]|nr:hypothetical protein [Vibrio parahaemolyticus]HAT8487250.1 hypothetical protein [Vibrio vulnificus]
MAPQFSQTEKQFIDLVNSTPRFTLNGQVYNVLQAYKPTTPKGECKTDVFIKTDIAEFKISIKQSNADFLENKMSYERAVQIFGADTDSILRQSIKSIEASFLQHPLICFEKMGRTEAKTMMLGWKFELVNKKGGDKSGILQLTDEQKLNVYSGHLLPSDKRNAYVNGKQVTNSGVADFILEIDSIDTQDLQYYINNLEPIAEFSKNQTIYFACKALNYRSSQDKWDGDRPLSVYVDWKLEGNGELIGSINYDTPLKIKGNQVGEQVRGILRSLGINNTNFDELKKHYHGISHPTIL